MSVLTPAYAIRQLLIDDTNTAAFIGTRIYAIGEVPQSAKRPFGMFETTDDTGEHHLNGASGLHWADIEITWVTDSKEQAENIADAARLATDGRPAGNVSIDSNTIMLRHLELKSQEDDFVLPADATAKGLTLLEQRFRVGYEKEPATFS